MRLTISVAASTSCAVKAGSASSTRKKSAAADAGGRREVAACSRHCTTAALMAVESPDEVGRTVYAALRDEYRQLARFLLTDSQKDMASHYAVKADLVERIKKDTDTPGKVSSGGDEKKVRKALEMFGTFWSSFASTFPPKPYV